MSDQIHDMIVFRYMICYNDLFMSANFRSDRVNVLLRIDSTLYLFIRSERAASKKTNNKSNFFSVLLTNSCHVPEVNLFSLFQYSILRSFHMHAALRGVALPSAPIV